MAIPVRPTMAPMPKSAPATIGQRIAAARAARGLNPSELARLVGIRPQSLYQIESGVVKSPTPANLFRIADALRVDARELVFGAQAALAVEQQVAPYRLDELFDEETLRFARRFAALDAEQRRSWMLGLLLNGRTAPDEAVERAYYSPTTKKKR